LCRDSVRVEIPLSITADVKIVLNRTRTKRIAKLRKLIGAAATSTNGQAAEHLRKVENGNKEIGDSGSGNKSTVPATTKGSVNGDNTKKKNKKSKSTTVRRSEFASTIEYLEAKYVQGVMFDNDNDDDDNDDDDGGDNNDDRDNNGYDSEGAGSVYSKDSFIEDEDLERTVAQQVVAQQVETTVSMRSKKKKKKKKKNKKSSDDEKSSDEDGSDDDESNSSPKKKNKKKKKGGNGGYLDDEDEDDDDDDFFVNVGNLEVEESEMTRENYDPLQDTDKTAATKNKKKKNGASRKRKKPTGGESTEAASSSTASKSPKAGEKSAASESSPQKNKKKKNKAKPVTTTAAASPTSAGSASASAEKPTSSSPPKKKKKSSADENDKPNNKSGGGAAAKKKSKKKEGRGLAKARKAAADKLYASLVAMIEEEDLPRRKTTAMVTLSVPAGKKTGDMVLFTNPHVSGQKMKVKVPAKTPPGGTFKVTVPVQDDVDEDTDYNKFSREFYDTLDDYARAYDDYVDAEAAVQEAAGNDGYSPHIEKRNKFDDLVTEFPDDLKTPVEVDYVKKLLRRARQNRSKREATLARQAMSGEGSPASASATSKSEAKGPGGGGTAAGKKKQQKKKKQPEPKSKSSPPKSPSPAVTMQTIDLPRLGNTFPTRNFREEDFL